MTKSFLRSDGGGTVSRSVGWPIGVKHLINSPADDLWSTISTPGNLELCHPFCKSNPVTSWPGPDSRDEVHYLNGKVYQRRFLDWDDGVGYDLEIFEQDQRLAFVEWRIEPAGETSSLSITVYPHVLERLPGPLRWVPHMVVLRPMLHRYLDSVVRGFEWYLTRGEPVPRNFFGPHRWFSK